MQINPRTKRGQWKGALFMPFINTKVNISLDDKKREAVKTRLGQAVSLIGKSEDWLMVAFEENCALYFKGEGNAPIAFCEVKLFGKAGKSAYKKMTAEVTKILSEELGIQAAQIYVKYEEVEHWGWNGANF